MKLFRPVTGIKTKKCYMQLLGLNPNGNGYVFVSRWESGKVRPGTRYLRRMVRLRLWADEGWPVDRLLSVDWLGMSMQWSDESDRNLFHLSAHTLFPFGSLRDGAQILRDTMQFHGIVHRAHMCRLLGLDPRRQYSTLYRWFHRLRELGPKYLLRLLLLLSLGPAVSAAAAGQAVVAPSSINRSRDGLNKSVDCGSTHRKLSRADGLFRVSLAMRP